MGYSFTYDAPSDHSESGCGFNSDQMNYVRLVMLEAGTITGNGLRAALSTPGLEVTDQTVPAEKFMHNGGEHITAAEAAFIAGRLRTALGADVVGDILMFFDDAPDTSEVTEWVTEFATFNDRAAARDGYYVG